MSAPSFSPGIILSVRPLRESDYIAVILTQDLGKIEAIARNARKSTRRFSGGLDILDSGLFELQKPLSGKTLYTLRSLEHKNLWKRLTSSLNLLSSALLIAEISERVCGLDDPNSSGVYCVLLETLICLDSLDKQSRISPVLVVALKQLLRHSGFSTQNTGAVSSSVSTTQDSAIADSPVHELRELLDYVEHCLEKPLKTRSNLQFPATS